MDTRFFVMDVDGTLTDGKLYIGENGEVVKAFHVRDGYGIKDLLPRYGIIPVIITARNSKILENRCRELGIREIHQNVHNKFEKLTEILQEYSEKDKTEYGLDQTAYIGDDVLDLQCMIPVKEAGGITGCPSDAAEEVIRNAVFVSSRDGGMGAVREFIEWLLYGQKR